VEAQRQLKAEKAKLEAKWREAEVQRRKAEDALATTERKAEAEKVREREVFFFFSLWFESIAIFRDVD
jgi:hypothetical protein